MEKEEEEDGRRSEKAKLVFIGGDSKRTTELNAEVGPSNEPISRSEAGVYDILKEKRTNFLGKWSPNMSRTRTTNTGN